MTPVDLTGWAAAALTLLAFTSRDLRLLRTASLGASLCFITYGTASEIWPVVALHSVLLPVNVWRLLELRRSTKRLLRTLLPVGQGHATAAAACACSGKPARRSASLRRLAPLALLLACTSMPAAATTTYAERMHAKALESFRQGRFPEAYGRFIDLANAGHPASARYALWMCEQGMALFGKDWDCAPHEAEDWARSAGVAPSALSRIGVRQYTLPTVSRESVRR